MLTFKRIVNINLASFSSSFVLLALVNFLGRYGTYFWGNTPKLINNLLWLFFVGAIMAYCGWFVSTSVAAKRKLPFALAFGGGYVLSRVITNASLWSTLGISVTDSWESFTVLFSSLIDGLLIGLLFGWVWKGWKASFIFAIAGGIIFELGYWANWLILYLVNVQIHHFVIPGNVGEGWIMATWVLAYLIFGLVIGGLWGVMIDRSNRINSSMKTSN